MKILLVAAFTTVLTFAQTPAPSGAKTLFFNPESGKETPISSPTSSGSQQLTTKPAITGLKYYIELRQPDGNLQRVSASRVFHSGDRIRFHVATNVDGDLVIYQQQESQPEERLYPASEAPTNAGHVIHGNDVTLPSAHGWFQFDEHPGQIHLTLMLTAAKASHSGQLPSADLAHKLAGATKGSKALRIEEDSTEDKAEYKVLDSRLDPKIPAGVIATEVTLSHAR